MKILFIEDEPSLLELMTLSLLKERYIVESASTFADANEKIGLYSYDCILLDIMLPDGNGLKLLEEIKKLNKRESVIIISARDSLEDKVAGLELGADDYLPKPFHLMELNARIKSVIRRSLGQGQRGYRFGNVFLDPERFLVTINDHEVELLKKEFDILAFSFQKPIILLVKLFWPEPLGGITRVRLVISVLLMPKWANLDQNPQPIKPNLQLKSFFVSELKW